MRYFRGTTLKMAAPSPEKPVMIYQTIYQSEYTQVFRYYSCRFYKLCSEFWLVCVWCKESSLEEMPCAPLYPWIQKKVSALLSLAVGQERDRCYMLSRGDRGPMGSLQDTSYTIPFKLTPYILQELWPHEQFTFSSSVLRYLISSQMWMNILCHCFKVSPGKQSNKFHFRGVRTFQYMYKYRNAVNYYLYQ